MTEPVTAGPGASAHPEQPPRDPAAELRDLRDRWHGATRDPAGALGFVEVAAAFRAMSTRWNDELDVQVRLIRELRDGIAGSVGGGPSGDATTRPGGGGPGGPDVRPP